MSELDLPELPENTSPALHQVSLVRVKQIIKSGYASLEWINLRLLEIVDEIRALQPRRDGMMVLRASKCSDKGCLQCPHLH